MHSSTVTVAVIDPKEVVKIEFNERDFKIEWYSGTGAGGQNRNKVQASCRLTHLPTGLVQTAQTRSRENSFNLALVEMLQQLNNHGAKALHSESNQVRSSQVGSGMRGDKIRTYRFQDNMVKDHQTGQSASCDRVMSGHFELMWV